MPRHRVLTLIAAIALVGCGMNDAAAQFGGPSGERSPWFEEWTFTTLAEPNVRMHVNAPLDEHGNETHATRLIIYALPNGNTLEQSLGCRLADGMDWHYDIQHVAAQVRLLRSLFPDERIVLICAEAEGLSWPAWRKNHANANAEIGRLVQQWKNWYAEPNAKVTITGHSGGGSFMFGLIEAADDIPWYVDRIAFLDSNYSFDAELHAAKLESWLKENDSNRLIVLAYDDREIMLNGKKVVGPTGGTFRATGRMHEALGKIFPLTDSEKPPFMETVGLDGRIHFYVHSNPENKILHTVLVGDMNGLVHIQTLGTAQEETWGKFGGPRAFTKWIQPEPTPKPKATNDDAVQDPAPADRASKIPRHPAGAVGGIEFIKGLEALSLDEREAAILREISGGNLPEFLRKFKTVPIRGIVKQNGTEKEVAAAIDVMPDFLAIGSDADFVRMPMTPQTAQRIADAFGCTLPTKKMVDALDAAADVHLEPRPMTEKREAVTTFFEHHQIIEQQRAGKSLGLLTVGIKKDIVLTPRIFEKPQRLAIYGWRQLDGKPIQPLTIVHWNRYVDYSHGVRLVRNAIKLQDEEVKITELLADPDRCGLVSDEGPMNPPRYPLDQTK